MREKLAARPGTVVSTDWLRNLRRCTQTRRLSRRFQTGRSAIPAPYLNIRAPGARRSLTGRVESYNLTSGDLRLSLYKKFVAPLDWAGFEPVDGPAATPCGYTVAARNSSTVRPAFAIRARSVPRATSE